ncbi:afadin- and alpha-actinin-binding protein B-like isoform X1 [Scyliorhinus torazame]|uniref:afadin- and alpha-actinin-binding protein B-like isoform X1 n=2 Tax=Scyliorhinus torazame TaxID=75743 RepID=UPI003B5B7560
MLPMEVVDAVGFPIGEMDDWRTPDSKSFIVRRVSPSASLFSPARTITLHCPPVLPFPILFNPDVFCWGDNAEECISYLNKELNTLGLPPLFDDSFEEKPASSCNVVTLINCVYSLLQLHWKNVANVSGLERERLKSFNEQDGLKSSQFKLQEEVTALEQEIAALQTKELQRQNSIRSLNNQLKNHKEEVVKLQSIIASRAAQYLHELKRKEQELNKLKEKIHHHLTDKKDKRIACWKSEVKSENPGNNQQARKRAREGIRVDSALDILNPIARSDGKRSLWRTGKTELRREEEMYKVLVVKYEAQIEELVSDNAELTRVLNQMKSEMSGFLSPHSKLGRAKSCQTLAEEVTIIESLDTSRGNLTECVEKQWSSLKDYMAKLAVTAMRKSPVVGKDEHVVSITDHDKEIAKLKLELEQSKEIMSAQQQLLEDQLAIQKEDLGCGLDFLEEGELFCKERQLFEEQKKNFEAEREKFTEAAIRLGQERKLFEEERALHLKEQFLNLTPFRDQKAKPKWKPRTPFAPNQENASPRLTNRKMGLLSMHSHRAPMHTPSPPTKCTNLRRHSLPTTCELYEVLGIIPEQSFRPATTVRHTRPCSTRESPPHQQDSATQTRDGPKWIRTPLFVNDSSDSLCYGHLCTPI